MKRSLAVAFLAISVLGSACQAPKTKDSTDEPSRQSTEPTAERVARVDQFRGPIAQDLVDAGWADELMLASPGEDLLRATIEKVDVLKAVRRSQLAFALFAIRIEDGPAEHGMAALSPSSGTWGVQELNLGKENFRPVPKSLNGSSFLPISTGGQGAFGGFVDPTVSRVEMIDGRTRVVDVDIPTEVPQSSWRFPGGRFGTTGIGPSSERSP
jgi:hypothetical protein